MIAKNLSLMFIILCFLSNTSNVFAQETVIPIQSQSHVIVLKVDGEKRLRTVYFGEVLNDKKEYAIIDKSYQFKDRHVGISNSAYTPSGTWNYLEPAIDLVHTDGNISLELQYVKHDVENIDENVQLTSIVLKDPVYPVQVTLFYKVFIKENVFEQWSEIKHNEKGLLKLNKYASANLFFTDRDYYLTTFNSGWAKEMRADESKLIRGIRSVDSKLGARAMLLQSPNFILSFNQPAAENSGSVILGQLAWSGNFKLEYELDGYKNLRFLAGINNHASEYHLPANEVLKTPSLLYAVSNNGTGEASRNLHSWARKYRVFDGEGERLTLLNNWEATYFDFDQEKLVDLFKGAKKLGVDLFLLDDGWFGNKHPRNSDNAGLGDWKENKKKLPDGIGYLVKEAKKESVKFGIWIEPEMVNPKSELYEKHPDWVIRQPVRPEIYFRNQLVLDLSNPKVQDYVYNIVDHLFVENPELAFIKWDCNAVIYNGHSAYLEKEGIAQSHLSVEYVKGLYKVLKKIRAKYEKVPMMLCSGGGGRGDYEALKYFTEFWPSDNTDPLERVFMQWNYSYIFPSIATDCHVTNWGKQSLKYKIDVASMGKLGFDIDVDELSEKELIFCQKAIQNYNSFKSTVWHGDLYRLIDPHTNNQAALLYSSQDKSKAVFFNYVVDSRLKDYFNSHPVKMNGLVATKKYRVKEINQANGSKTDLDNYKEYTGEFLMKVGINTGLNAHNRSVVLLFEEVK